MLYTPSLSFNTSRAKAWMAGYIKAAISSYTPYPNSDPVFEYNKNGVFCDVAFTQDKHILIRFNPSDTFQQII